MVLTLIFEKQTMSELSSSILNYRMLEQSTNGNDWLINNIEAFEDKSSLQLPKKSNGTEFNI